jgi:fructose-1,6-bisphosphatase/inositol monophosphatase family enzyme
MMADLPVSRSGKTAAAVARACAQEAGRIAMDAFGRRQDVQVKGRGNFLTETDLAAEQAVLAILRKEYPDHELLAEESAGDATSPSGHGNGWMWVVDPLDGTHNFSRGIPYFAFNIALCYEREPLLGLTYAPATGEEFFAEAGKGLTVNGQPVRASTAERLSDCVLGVDLGYEDARAARMLELVAEVWPVQGVRVLGSAALGLAYAACGRYDLFIHHFLYPWDVAAGIVLVREGGGAVLDRGGGAVSVDSEGVVAGAPGAVEELLALARDRPWRE